MRISECYTWEILQTKDTHPVLANVFSRGELEQPCPSPKIFSDQSQSTVTLYSRKCKNKTRVPSITMTVPQASPYPLCQSETTSMFDLHPPSIMFLGNTAKSSTNQHQGLTPSKPQKPNSAQNSCTSTSRITCHRSTTSTTYLQCTRTVTSTATSPVGRTFCGTTNIWWASHRTSSSRYFTYQAAITSASWSPRKSILSDTVWTLFKATNKIWVILVIGA